MELGPELTEFVKRYFVRDKCYLCVVDVTPKQIAELNGWDLHVMDAVTSWNCTPLCIFHAKQNANVRAEQGRA